MEVPDKTWAVQDAKARLSELLDGLSRGPQMITKHGTETAVVISVAEWRRLKAAARPSLKDLLLSDVGRGELNIPPRGDMRFRKPVELE
jgi:antitoxin Phd